MDTSNPVVTFKSCHILEPLSSPANNAKKTFKNIIAWKQSPVFTWGANTVCTVQIHWLVTCGAGSGSGPNGKPWALTVKSLGRKWIRSACISTLLQGDHCPPLVWERVLTVAQIPHAHAQTHSHRVTNTWYLRQRKPAVTLEKASETFAWAGFWFQTEASRQIRLMWSTRTVLRVVQKKELVLFLLCEDKKWSMSALWADVKLAFELQQKKLNGTWGKKCTAIRLSQPSSDFTVITDPYIQG